MISKQTAQKTQRNGGTLGAAAWIAGGLGLGVSMVVLAFVLAGSPSSGALAPSALHAWNDVRVLMSQLAEQAGLIERTTPLAMQSHPLGIDLPHGADRRDLPHGLTDYLRPGSRMVPIAMQSHPLGIDLPHGADVHTLPWGLTDYLRSAGTLPVAMQSHPLGIDLPHGADVHTLPSGLTDYLRSQAHKPPMHETSTLLGIMMPIGAQRSDLPPGVTDYLRTSH